MGDLNLQQCLIYLDDIIIFSRNIGTYLDRLDSRLQTYSLSRSQTYNLKIKPSKCEFFKTSITNLGRVILEHGIQANSKKIKAIKNWLVSKTVKDVQKFFDFDGYYWGSGRGFAGIARPLNKILVGHPTKKTKNSKTAKNEKSGSRKRLRS